MYVDIKEQFERRLRPHRYHDYDNIEGQKKKKKKGGRSQKRGTTYPKL